MSIEKETPTEFLGLEALKGEVLHQVQSLAKDGDTTGLFAANDWLRSAVGLIKRHEALRIETLHAINSGRRLLNSTSPPAPLSSVAEQSEDMNDDPTHGGFGGKARGRQCRDAFVLRESQRGKPLTILRGQLHKTASGMIVGIGYGREDEEREQCFVGLPAGQFQEAVLLCELLTGVIQPFWLPAEFIAEYGKFLSISKRYNQAKFTIMRNSGGFELRLPTVGAKDVTHYRDSEPLQLSTHAIYT